MKKQIKHIVLSGVHTILVSAILLTIFVSQISFAQNIKEETYNHKNLTKASLKQVPGNNLENAKNYPKVIALKPDRSFEEVLLEWQRTSNNETYKELIAENIKHRLQFLEQKSNSVNKQQIHELKNIIETDGYIKNDNLAIKALIKIAQLEKYYLSNKLVTAQELEKYNSIKPSDIKNKPFSTEGVSGKINWVKSSLYEKNGIGYYKEGTSPGSGISRHTNISVTNNGTKTTDYFVKVSDENRPDGWDMFWWKIILPHQSPTFTLTPGQTLELVGANQSQTQSPNYETGDTWVYYDLYQDRNWPIPNLWLSGINKRNRNDATDPTSSVNSLAPTQSSTIFQVSWIVNDPGIGSSGIDFYSVVYKTNTSGTWYRWQSNPSYRSAPFTGEEGLTYYFASAALDNVGHSKDFPRENGETQTYILKHFNVTTSSNPSNGGATAGGGNYTENSTATVSASVNLGWHFEKWTENNSVKSYSPGYSFTVTQNIHLVANFSINSPTPPTNLSTNVVSDNQINLNWTDNSNNEDGFRIERETNHNGNWEQIGTVGSNVKSYEDNGLSSGTPYCYRVRAYNSAGNSGYSNTACNTTTTAVTDEKSLIPPVFKLFGNYPNPFNATTTIKYDLPKSTFVTLEIFNIEGQLFATLVNEQKTAGRYSSTWDATNVSSGVYIYRITAGDFSDVKKGIILK